MSENKKSYKFLDLSNSLSQQRVLDLEKISSPGKFQSTLFSRGKKSSKFYTEDSKLYITPKEFAQLRKNIKLDRKIKKWDSLSSRIVNDFVYSAPSQSSILLKSLEERYAKLNESLLQSTESLKGQFTMVRLWNLSMVGSILFGMVVMTFVYRYLGQGASADQLRSDDVQQQSQQIQPQGKVLAADTSKDQEEFAKQVLAIEQANDKKALREQLQKILKGYPMEKMIPYIAENDRSVAAFIVGIAKQESSWGQHAPVLNGQDCYNYWGYRGQRKLMGTGGHTCFNSPKDAVETVAKRISDLINNADKGTPSKMVNTWKCGTSCQGDNGAQRWVSTVTEYFNKLDTE